MIPGKDVMWRGKTRVCIICKDNFMPYQYKNMICSKPRCKYERHLERNRVTQRSRYGTKEYRIKKAKQLLESHGYTITKV